ncbi:MAG TPA: hypothetical protein VIU15_47220, partial [Streptomyces sp.]
MERELEELAAEAARVLGAVLLSDARVEVLWPLSEWFDDVDPGGHRPPALSVPHAPLRARHLSDALDRASEQQANWLRELVGQYKGEAAPALPDTPPRHEPNRDTHAPTHPAPADSADRVTTLTSMLVGAKLEQPSPATEDEPHSVQPLRPHLSHADLTPADPTPTPTYEDHNDFRDGTFHAPVTGSVRGNVYINYPTPVPDPTTWPTLADADPLALGVRGALRLKEWTRLTEYVQRDVEADLEGWFEEDGLLVLTGRQFAGKTRTAWEVLRGELPPEARVYTPTPGTDLRALPGLLAGRPGRYALWLDNLGEHLTQRDLDTTLLAELKRARIPVVGTMNDTTYETHMDAADTLAHRVLALARVERLSRAWSETELLRAGESVDPRLVEALEWKGDTGVTQYL